MTFDQYLNCLKAAAQVYDCSMHNTHQKCHQVNQTKTTKTTGTKRDNDAPKTKNSNPYVLPKVLWCHPDMSNEICQLIKDKLASLKSDQEHLNPLGNR